MDTVGQILFVALVALTALTIVAGFAKLFLRLAGHRSQKKGIPMPLAENEIFFSLQRLVQTPSEKRPFLVIEDRATERFVQFRGSDQESLLLDLPCLDFSMTQILCAKEILGTNVVWLELNGTPHQTLQKDGLTPSEGATLAMRILRQVHRLEENTVLLLTEGTTER